MPCVEAKPSGKFEIKIAAMRTMFTAPPVTKEIPRASPLQFFFLPVATITISAFYACKLCSTFTRNTFFVG
jgi:hypothetical protein